MDRIQKILSAAGVCSRRLAEEYLRAGRVTVNGQVAGLGDKADPAVDDIRLDGKAVAAIGPRVYLMLNKPRGYVTTLSDEFNRPTVIDLTAGCGQRIFPIGRLDRDSDGLLLLTNDGGLAERLSHPRYETEKEYRVTVGGNLKNCVERLEAVTQLDNKPIARVKVSVVAKESGYWTLSFILHQGLNRQIRRMCQDTNLSVLRLQRIREGNLVLGDLPQGQWRYLTDQEVRDAYHHVAAMEGMGER